MNVWLGLCKPKCAPKYMRVSHFLLLHLATSSANSPKAKSWPLSACTLSVHVKVVACSTLPGDGPVEVVWERLWAASPWESLCDSKSTNGDHGGESMRHLSHYLILIQSYLTEITLH